MDAYHVIVDDNVVVKIEGTVETTTAITNQVAVELQNDVLPISVQASAEIPVSISGVVSTRTELASPVKIDTQDSPVKIELNPDFIFKSLVSFEDTPLLDVNSTVTFAENQQIKALIDFPEVFKVQQELGEINVNINSISGVSVSTEEGSPLEIKFTNDLGVRLTNESIRVLADLAFPSSHRTDVYLKEAEVALKEDTVIGLKTSDESPIKIQVVTPVPSAPTYGVESILFVLFEVVTTQSTKAKPGDRRSVIEYFEADMSLKNLAEWIESSRVNVEKEINGKVAIVDYRLTQRKRTTPLDETAVFTMKEFK